MTLVEFVVLRLLLICERDTVSPLSTVLTAVLRLVVDEMAPLNEELTWDSEAVCPLSTLLTAVLRLDVEEIAPLRDELICETDVERPISGVPLGPLGCNGSPIC